MESKEKEDELRTDDKEPHCLHYVKRKKRFCKMTLKSGFQYCGEHLPKDNKDSSLLRITCPLDRTHTCYAYNLKKHLKICNAKPKDLPFILKGINRDSENVPEEINQTRQLANAKAETVIQVIDKIKKVYEAHKIGNIQEAFKSHVLLQDEVEHPDYSVKTKKHLIQVSSILGMLQENNLLQDETCYIEFGAGKGQLSFWLSRAIENYKNSAVLLVERASHRHKKDNKVDKTVSNIYRVKADIGDLILKKVDVLENYKNVIGVTKHLCGEATDLAFRCLKNFAKDGGNVKALLMAFCCHHRCLWDTFTGKDFFLENGLNKEDFDIMCGLVSWAICGTGQSREKNEKSTVNTDVLKNQRDQEIGLSREEKKEIGIKSKNLIDYARTQFLVSNGFKSELQFYVPWTVSPENVCALAISMEDKGSAESATLT